MPSVWWTSERRACTGVFGMFTNRNTGSSSAYAAAMPLIALSSPTP
ncbi:hypothetical protein [Herbidospora sp. NBRC 101105]|nr:hypothetical protein [Herbidospora sp. NBRC 101105]